jgi:hypothetical protein
MDCNVKALHAQGARDEQGCLLKSRVGANATLRRQ